MCRYKSEGDPKGRSDCDSLRDENLRVHEMNQKLHQEICKLREERRWIEGRVVISRETFDKVVAALSGCTIVANDDGEEWNDEEVIDARDSISRDAKMPLPPGPGVQGEAREVEDNMTRVVVGRLNLDEALKAVSVCVKAEVDYLSAARDFRASVMALRDSVCALDYDARHPRGGEEG
jgi:hypothetical protein